MIAPKKKHVEKQKLSDKFPQPFTERTGAVHEFIKIFNGKRQKKKGKR
jgi:hypothetical protein